MSYPLEDTAARARCAQRGHGSSCRARRVPRAFARRLAAAPVTCSSVALALCAMLCGCAADSEHDEGRFTVEATLVEACAETGLLAAPTTQSLRVWMRQVSARSMHWDDGGGRLIGSYDPDSRIFAVERRTYVDMREPDSELPACTIVRVMRVEGTLDATAVEQATGFEGVQRYEYAPTDGSSCDDLLGSPDGLAASLPCAVVYELVGERL